MSSQTSAGGAAAPTNPAPPSTDPLPQNLVNAMQGIFGKHAGYRTTHAKGLLVEGKFTPTHEAKSLSVAHHFHHTTPVIARFSVGGGIPHIKDIDENATPKGIAIRFKIGHDTHTDLISHTFNGFAARTGEGFLAFLKVFGGFGAAKAAFAAAQAKGGDTTKEQDALKQAGAAFQSFLASNPSAAAFVGSEKPDPFNYGTITYYEPNTHVLTNHDGKVTNVRYRLIPADGDHLYKHDADLAKLTDSYLEDDLKSRFPGKPIIFTIKAHIANPDDVLDDATIPYKSTTFVDVGKLEINKVAANNPAEQQQIAFSPVPDRGGVKGIACSKDPLIQTRKGVYYISSEQRRHEKQVE